MLVALHLRRLLWIIKVLAKLFTDRLHNLKQINFDELTLFSFMKCHFLIGK